MSGDGAEMRRLSVAEAELFRDIRLEGLQDAPDAFASTFESESARPLSFFEDRLANAVVFGAFRGSELLGVAGFYVQPGAKEAHKGMLWGMYVRPAARNLGLGRKLVETVLEYARSRVELIQLFVIGDNVAARRLYERMGFEQYGLEKRATKYRGRYHDDVLMAKMLVPEFETASAAPNGGDDR